MNAERPTETDSRVWILTWVSSLRQERVRRECNLPGEDVLHHTDLGRFCRHETPNVG